MRRCDIGGGSPAAGMRPVGAPHHTIGVRRDKRLRERRRVGKIRGFILNAVGSQNLHVGAARPDEIDHGVEAGLARAEGRPSAAEMVDDDRERQGIEIILAAITGSRV